jgi:hypothetical protein
MERPGLQEGMVGSTAQERFFRSSCQSCSWIAVCCSRQGLMPDRRCSQAVAARFPSKFHPLYHQALQLTRPCPPSSPCPTLLQRHWGCVQLPPGPLPDPGLRQLGQHQRECQRGAPALDQHQDHGHPPGQHAVVPRPAARVLQARVPGAGPQGAQDLVGGVGGRVWQGRRNGREREGGGTPGRHAIIIVQQQYTCNRKRGRKVEHRTWLPFSQPLQPSQAAAAGAEQIAKLPNCQHF